MLKKSYNIHPTSTQNVIKQAPKLILFFSPAVRDENGLYIIKSMKTGALWNAVTLPSLYRNRNQLTLWLIFGCHGSVSCIPKVTNYSEVVSGSNYKYGLIDSC